MSGTYVYVRPPGCNGTVVRQRSTLFSDLNGIYLLNFTLLEYNACGENAQQRNW